MIFWETWRNSNFSPVSPLTRTSFLAKEVFIWILSSSRMSPLSWCKLSCFFFLSCMSCSYLKTFIFSQWSVRGTVCPSAVRNTELQNKCSLSHESMLSIPFLCLGLPLLVSNSCRIDCSVDGRISVEILCLFLLCYLFVGQSVEKICLD